MKIVNAAGEDVTDSYKLSAVQGVLKITHNTTLAPDRIEAVKTRTAYKAGDALNLDDLTVTVYYADGYSEVVTGYTTNASMTVPHRIVCSPAVIVMPLFSITTFFVPVTVA